MTNRQKLLWLRWVCANAFGELFGLGATFIVTVWVLTRVETGGGIGAVLFAFAFAVASGAIEATLVGLAQWWAMHPWFPQIGRRDWWQATFWGALVAYVLGYLPSTLMDLGASATSGTAPPTGEPPQVVVLLLAAGLGAVGGAVLSFAQWLVLRRSSRRAGLWIPANMLAWAAGMPVIFWGIDAAQKGQPLAQALLLMALALLVAGAVVGAVHGVFLVRIWEQGTNQHDEPVVG